MTRFYHDWTFGFSNRMKGKDMVETSQLQETIERLEKLERHHRRMKCAGGIVLVLGVAALIMGQVAPQIISVPRKPIQAREIHLRDQDGVLRMRLTATRSGSEIVMLDAKLKPLVMLGTGTDGSGLSLHDKAGAPRVSLGATDVGEFTLFDENRKARMIATAKQSYTGLCFYDDQEQTRISFGTTKEDTGLVLYDASKKPRAILGTTSKMDKKRPESALSLFDEKGKLLWDAP